MRNCSENPRYEQKRAISASKRALIFSVFAAALFFDLVTKIWVRVALPTPNGLKLTSQVSLIPRVNFGTTFGFLSGQTETGFMILTLVTGFMALGLIWLAIRAQHRLASMGAAVMASGAFGNLIDRSFEGAVTDFIELHLGAWHSPVFNLADLWLIIGFVLLVSSSDVRTRNRGL